MSFHHLQLKFLLKMFEKYFQSLIGFFQILRKNLKFWTIKQH